MLRLEFSRKPKVRNMLNERPAMVLCSFQLKNGRLQPLDLTIVALQRYCINVDPTLAALNQLLMKSEHLHETYT